MSSSNLARAVRRRSVPAGTAAGNPCPAFSPVSDGTQEGSGRSQGLATIPICRTLPAVRGRTVHLAQPVPETPYEARLMLEQVARLLATGQPLPPSFRVWVVDAIRERVTQPGASLDHLLGLRSRNGGVLHAASRLPARDLAIQQLMAHAGTADSRVRALTRRVQAHHRTKSDAELAEFEARYGRIPGWRQLHRILAGQTVAAQLGASIGARPGDNAPNVATLGQHHPKREP